MGKSTKPKNHSPEVSVVMPCLNEEETVGKCIKKTFDSFKRLNIEGELIVCDNGSRDRSVQIAKSLGARVVYQEKKGYGSAYMKGFEEARGKYIIMGDSDDSYDFSDMERFIAPLREGKDMVMGSRFKGKIIPGAMPWHHRYIGNPLLSWFLNRFFKTGISDAHCGMRSLTREAYRKMRLCTTGMEFASEMVINAAKAGLDMVEIPITFYPDGRSGRPHIRSFRDGWRHLRFMLMYSPTHLFLIPGAGLMLIGLVLSIVLLRGPIFIGGRGYSFHLSILGSLLTLLGFQIINLGLYAKAYSFKQYFERDDKFIEKFYRYFRLEWGLVVGFSLFMVGLLMDFFILYSWIKGGFGALLQVSKASFATTLMVMGVQIIFSSFFLSMLDVKKKVLGE